MKNKTPIGDREEFIKFIIDSERKGFDCFGVYQRDDGVYDLQNQANAVWSWIQSHLDTAFLQGREEAIKEIKNITQKMKVGESEGWDFFFGNDPQCCPGDDYADIYNLAIKRVRQKLSLTKNKGKSK